MKKVITLNKRELEKIWNQVPANYYEQGVANNLLKRYWHSSKLNTFQSLTKSINPKTILDVGCASGRMANEVSKIFPSAKVSGVDVYKKAIKFGKEKYPNIRFYVGDGHKLPFRSNSFDLVMTFEVIEHVVDPFIFLKEIQRVMKKDGRALVAMDSGSLLFRIVWLVCEKTISRVWQNAHLHPFKHSELEKLIKKSDFKIVRKRFSHFGMEVTFLLKIKK